MFNPNSFGEPADPGNLRLSALEKLHFLDGRRAVTGCTGGDVGDVTVMLGKTTVLSGSSVETPPSSASVPELPVTVELEVGNTIPATMGGVLYALKSLGRGGTGGISAPELSSSAGPLDASLPALFLRSLRLDRDIEVALVAAEREAESRDPVVGVPVKVVEEAELRFGVGGPILTRAPGGPSLLDGFREVPALAAMTCSGGGGGSAS
jgi:hypothetical protein